MSYQPPYGPGPPHHPPQVIVRRGIHPAWHVVHAVFTLFSCGLWSPVWFLHWLIGRGKTTVRYR